MDRTSGAILVETDTGEPRFLNPDYVADHLEHAYALTAHAAQGGTFHWAGVIGRPTEFTREWAYTALSRARITTTIHLIAEPPERHRERDQYAPSPPSAGIAELVPALCAALKRAESEPLAADQVDPAVATSGPPSTTHTDQEFATWIEPSAPPAGTVDPCARGPLVQQVTGLTASAGPAAPEPPGNAPPSPRPLKGLPYLQRASQRRHGLTRRL
jgi:hypothetical protein